MKSKLAAALIAVVVTVIGAGILIDVIDNGPDHGPNKPRREVVIKLGGAGQAVTLPPAAQVVAQSQAAQDAAGQEQAAHSDLRAEPPAALAPSTLKANRALKPAGQVAPPAHVPLAAVEQPGCRTLLVRNKSSRQGSPILLGVLHQTISADNGWPGVLGNVKWFDTPAAQASSNYVVARTGGQCALTVAETDKAWAQAGFNRVALSVEVTETGREGSYLPAGSPGRARVLALMRAWHHRWRIPYRHGRVSGCTVTVTGFVEHADLGPCGGGHHDDDPPCNGKCLDVLIRQAAAGDRPAGPSASVVTDCRHVARWRARYPRGRGSSPTSRAHVRGHLAHAKRAGYACKAGSGKPSRL